MYQTNGMSQSCGCLESLSENQQRRQNLQANLLLRPGLPEVEWACPSALGSQRDAVPHASISLCSCAHKKLHTSANTSAQSSKSDNEELQDLPMHACVFADDAPSRSLLPPCKEDVLNTFKMESNYDDTEAAFLEEEEEAPGALRLYATGAGLAC